jgi:hypothetical protein
LITCILQLKCKDERKKGITDLIRGDATCPYMKNIPGLKKDFEVFKKDGSVSIKDFEI